MKKTTYDAISTIAVVSLVVFTVAAQHSSRAGYAFGILAILTAVGLFAAYVKALPRNSTTDQPAIQADEAAKQSQIDARKQALVQEEILMRQVRADMYRRLLVIKRDPIGALFKDRVRERQLQLQFFSEHHGRPAGSYYKQVKIHPVQDPASIIVKVIEKLCAGSKEPRFDFILGPDGSFKIQQVSVKRAVEEYAATREEPSDEELRERKVIPLKIRAR